MGLVGNAPNQVPTNGDLGPLAFRDENPSGAVVGTNAMQVLTNKTITNPVVDSGTANGVTYLNGSKVLSAGSVLTFDGVNLTAPVYHAAQGAPGYIIDDQVTGAARSQYINSGGTLYLGLDNSAGGLGGPYTVNYWYTGNYDHVWASNNVERMRLTSTGLGIGTSSPASKLDVLGAISVRAATSGVNQTINAIRVTNSDNTAYANAEYFANSHRWCYSGAVEGLRLDSSGNVGIGTSSPAHKLSVSGNGVFVGSVNTTGGGNGFRVDGIIAVDRDQDNNVTLIGGADNTLRLRTGSATKATLDASGNLGLGVVPSAWQSAVKAIQVGPTGAMFGYSAGAGFGSNFYSAAGTNRYIASGLMASLYEHDQGGHKWYVAPSGTAGSPITFTQAMTLDASGNLGIGVVPSAWLSQFKTIDIHSGATFAGTASTARVFGNSYCDTGFTYRYKTNGSASYYYCGDGVHQWSASPSGTAGAAITFTLVLAVEKDKSLALQGATSQTGAGISFPATHVASTDANTLDDYREGTFTPTIVGTTVAGAGTYTIQAGTYTRIGRLVKFTLNISWTAHTGTGSLQINGLPFTSQAMPNQYPVCNVISDLIALTAGSVACAFVPVSSTSVAIRQMPTGGGTYATVPMDTAGQLLISGHYEV